ncbi:MAG: class II fructose-bisphosphate aldolase [Alistipes sp.]|jgi:fructose-bisphosphate aldolase class II|nr:class II fructose-bisphosphate aldolase [Alistipes sp.]
MIVSLKEMLQEADKGRYAVGAFNCLSLENVEGAIAAAEELRSPIIIQLAEVQFPCAPMNLMAPIYLEAARRASVPVVVHLDHGQSFETCAEAIRLGFGSVMFDGASLPFEENVRITREVTRMAKAMGVDVEAELGKVGDVGKDDDKADVFTDVEESARFIELTGVDALAVAIGNQHGRYVATPKLNIDRLIELHERNRMPLVLHGGSGTSVEDFKACIHNGICKINVATAIQVGITERVQQYLREAANPDYITMKGVIREASKEVVKEHILLFESNNRA